MKKKKAIYRWLFILCAVGITAWLNRYQLPRIRDALFRISPLLLITALLCSLLYFFWEGSILTLLSRKYNRNFGRTDGITGAFFAQFYRMLTLGSGTALSEIYYLHTKKIPAASATGMCLVQYLAQRMTIAFLGLLSGAYLFVNHPDLVLRHRFQIILSYSLALIVLGVIVFAGTCKRAVARIFCFLELHLRQNSRFYANLFAIKQQVDLFQQACRELLLEKARLLRLFFLNILKLLCNMVIPAILLFQSEAPEDFFLHMALTGMAFVLAGVIPAPGGIGSLEWVFVLLFRGIVSTGTAAAAVIIYRLLTSMLPFLIGAVVSALYRSGEAGYGEFEHTL
ncbi:MAG: lysylphosphatidylglycerol synthase transmembrane domain-containing protein [Lachnospiraceae bacterium]|nr:lysylphosphatidylglycerol synthase transmembrane domain-containing protein [Lachnospiraceae bacterium]